MIQPDVLYRGVTLDPAILEDDIAFAAAVRGEGGLHPGSLRVNEEGKQCVFTGDEYGVYMSGKQSIAETYAELSEQDQLLGFGRTNVVDGQEVEFTLPDTKLGNVRTTLSKPSLGVVYEIQAAGLPGLRLPEYRKGRVVTDDELAFIPEWIADEVPEGHIRPVSVVVGADIVKPTRSRYDVATHGERLYQKVSATFVARLGNLSFFASQLKTISDVHNPQEAARVLRLAKQFS